MDHRNFKYYKIRFPMTTYGLVFVEILPIPKRKNSGIVFNTAWITMCTYYLKQIVLIWLLKPSDEPPIPLLRLFIPMIILHNISEYL